MYFEGRHADVSKSNMTIRGEQKLLLCGLDAVNAVMEAFRMPGFDKTDFDIINMQVQEAEEELAAGTPATGIQRKGNYNIEILRAALGHRAVDTEQGDHTKIHELESSEAIIAGSGLHWNAFVAKAGRWWHVEKEYCVPVQSLSRHIRAVIGKNGMFLRMKRQGSNTQRESTQNILLEIAARGPPAVVLQIEGQNNSSHSPIVIDDEVITSTEEQCTAAEDRAGDVLAEDAPSNKKARHSGWREIMIGTVPMYENEEQGRWRCPIDKCSFENDNQRSVTVHVALHRARMSSSQQCCISQDLLQEGFPPNQATQSESLAAPSASADEEDVI